MNTHASTNRQRTYERFTHNFASLIAIAALASLAACGGGGTPATGPSPALDQPDPPIITPIQEPPETSPVDDTDSDSTDDQTPDTQLPAQHQTDSLNAPILTIGSNLHIGLHVAPSPDELEQVTTRSDTTIFHGTTADGVDADTLIAYLADDARDNTGPNNDELHIHRFASPPTVRIADNTDQHMAHLTVRALQIINAALPHDWQLELHPTRGPSTHAAHLNPPMSEIHIQFAATADWPSNPFPDQTTPAYARTFMLTTYAGPHSLPTVTLSRASVLIDHTVDRPDEAILDTLIHEILHTLGREHATAPYSNRTIMRWPAQPPNMLYPLDRHALLAIYSRLQPGTTVSSLAENLGPWTDTSNHLLARTTIDSQDIAYGIAIANGLASPWATGPTPLLDLADNDTLSQTATWTGHLLGFTPEEAALTGDADLTVHLETLDGSLHFSQIEHWPINEPPGARGDGTLWTNGTLDYAISVDGNTFTRTSGDDGILTGAFLGTEHQAMGGTLQRDDLSAAFGGTR